MNAWRATLVSAASLALALTAACASTHASPAGAKVPVYQAPADAPAEARALPPGCAEVLRKPPEHWSELDRTGSADPFRTQRDETAAAGGNVLLLLDRQITPRECDNCPAASPITDCPPCFGAWYDVVFVSYACRATALNELPPERLP